MTAHNTNQGRGEFSPLFFSLSYMNNKGFTIVELLMVTVVISIIATIAIVQFTQYRKNAVKAMLISDIRNCITTIANSKQTRNYGINCTHSSGVTLSIVSPESPIIVTATHSSFNASCTYNENSGDINCSY